LTAVLSKQTARRALAAVAGGYRTYDTTTGGSSSTAIIAALSGIGADYLLAMPWGLANDGTQALSFRRASQLDSTTVTFANAFGGTIATAVSMDFYPFRPSLYTEALNRAMAKLYPGVYRIVTSHLITHAARKTGQGNAVYPFPRNMQRVHRLTHWGSTVATDLFDRAASTTTPGDGWTVDVGTFGVISERGYAVTDADGDRMSRTEDMKDGVLEMIVRGTLNSGATYRSPALLFRMAEDYTGAIDYANCLVVRLLNAVVDLRKRDGGTETSLATATQTTSDGVDYVLRVQFVGDRIRVWVDDLELISFQLTGLNAKYLQNPRVGVRLDKGGSPATAARFDDFYAFGQTSPFEWTDWEQNRDSFTLNIPAISTTAPTGLLLVEGSAPLTAFAADGTEALVTDTTAIVEIATTDFAYLTLIEQARAELFRLLSAEIYPTGIPQNSAQYLELAKEAAMNAAAMKRMPRAAAGFRHAQIV